MSAHNITIGAGKKKRLQTAGKYCDRDIVVAAEGSDAPIYDGEPLDITKTEINSTHAVFTAQTEPVVVDGEVSVRMPKNNLGWASANVVPEGYTFTSRYGINIVGEMPIYDYTPLVGWADSSFDGNEEYDDYLVFSGSTEQQCILEDEVSIKVPRADFGNAKPEDVRAGKIFTSINGLRQVGTDTGEGGGGGTNYLQNLIDSKNSNCTYLFTRLRVANADFLVNSLDFSNATDTTYMFSESASLTSVPLFDTSKVTTMANMFRNCYALVNVPAFNTNKVSTTANMFYGCTALKTVPALNMYSVSTTTGMFTSCRAMTECWIKNIRRNITVGAGTTYGHLLTVESLLHLCKECHNSTTQYTLTIGTANLAKLESVYVKLIDVTDDMEEADEYIRQKYPFEQCDSTDDDAMTIADYMANKGWSLA